MSQVAKKYKSSGAKWAWAPNKFTPDHKPLLSKVEWQKMQLGLNDMVALYPNIVQNKAAEKYFPTGTLHLLKELSQKANNFRTHALLNGVKVAGNLKSYAELSASKYHVLVNVLDHVKLNAGLASTLLGGLVAPAKKYEAEALALQKLIIEFNEFLGTAIPEIQNGLKIVKENITGEAGDIHRVNADMTHQLSMIHTAQAAILSDKKTLNDTLKYSWAAPIGTIIAIVKIVGAEKDIKTQWGIIKDAEKAIQHDVAKLSADALTLAELHFAELSFERAIRDINDIHQSVGKMAGTWSNIYTDLGGIVSDLTKKPDSSASTTALKEFDEVSNLTAAENEWNDLHNLTEDFIANFALSPS